MRKVFNHTGSRMLGNDGKLHHIRHPSTPIPIPGSGTAPSGVPHAHVTAAQETGSYNPEEANDASTIMIGGIPCVTRRSYGGA